MEQGTRIPSRRPFVIVALILLAVVAAGCAKVSGSDGWARPEVTGKVMYVTLEKGKLTAVDTPTFQKIWTFPAGDEYSCGGGEAKKDKPEGIYGSPAVDDENVYYATYDGAVFSVKGSDGTCNWRVETGDTMQAGPVLGTEGLYVGANDGNVYLLDTKTGDTKQKFNTGAVWATPLLESDGLYVATMTGKLWKLDLKTLESKWSAPFTVSAGLLTPPALAGDDTILVGGIGKKMYGIDTATGDQRWSVSGGNWFWGEPLVDGTNIYATDLDGEVTAINGTDGSKMWDAPFTALHPIRSGPVLAGDTLVTVDNDGYVYRIDPSTGQGVGQPNLLNDSVHATPLVLNAGPASSGTASATRIPSPAASGSAGGEKVYIVTTGGHLFEFDPDAARATEVVSK